MATVAEFVVPADAFPLGRLFDHLPEASVELERVVPTERAPFPYFWVHGVDAADALAVLAEDDAIESVTLVGDLGDQALFRTCWADDVDSVLAGLVETDVTLLRGVGAPDGWTFEVRADDNRALSTFYEYCRERTIPIVQQVQSFLAAERGTRYGVTDKQCEALLLAFCEGYYETPRGATLEELSTELGISRPSVSSRLRNGYRNLLRHTLIEHEES